MKYKILPAIALFTNFGCTYMHMPVNIPNNHFYNSDGKTASSQIRCPAPQITESFLPTYGIENLVAELENPIDINMDIRSGKPRLDYVVCAYNSKSSHNKPVKVELDEEKIRFLTGSDYDALAIYVKNEGNLESEANIYRQIEDGREVTYINFDSKYIGNISGKGGNFMIRLNYWRPSLINRTVFMILHKRAEKNGLLNPPSSEQNPLKPKGTEIQYFQ